MTEDGDSSDAAGDGSDGGEDEAEILGMYEGSESPQADTTVDSSESTPQHDGTSRETDRAGSAKSDGPESGFDGDSPEPRFDAPLIEPGGGEDPETAYGTFYVKHAEETAVTLHEVETSQIFTLIENPGFERHDIVEASLVAQPPMEVSYRIADLDAHYSVPVERSPESPTSHVQDLADDLAVGESLPIARQGAGEIHILKVDPDMVDHTAEELLDDELTYKNAARYGVGRVEIRTHDADGIVSIRYLP